MDVMLTAAQMRRWKVAVFVIFMASGLSMATWASRVPAMKVALDIDNIQIGMLLLSAAIASIIGLWLAPVILARFGARIGMLGAILVFSVGVALIGAGADLAHSPVLVAVGLALFGLGNGAVDVMMNVEGAAIEKQVDKTILPLFHAFFSLGTVIGAGLGALAALWAVNVFTHTAIMAIALVVIGFATWANVPAREVAMDPDAEERTHWRDRLRMTMSAWAEPRTYAIGLIVLGMAFAEGGANDWLALSVVDGHSAQEAVGAAALAVFSVSMTVVRAFGGPLVDRFGRVTVLRVLAATAAIGLLLFILAPNLPLMFTGAVLWGAGVSLGFPLGFSAAADDPLRAAARVSAVGTIGYIAFLAGPPILGVISESIGILNTLYILVGLIVISGFASSAARPIAGSTVGAGHPHERTKAGSGADSRR